jgi:hypothetical protein
MRTFAIVAAAALIVSTSSADAVEIDAMITTAMNAAIEDVGHGQTGGGRGTGIQHSPCGRT